MNNNILHLDKLVRNKIHSETNNLEKYRKELRDEQLRGNDASGYEVKAEKRNESKKIQKLKDKISDIESGAMFAEYILKTEKLIEEYLLILNKPINVSFFGNMSTENTKSDRQQEIYEMYINIAKNYIDVNVSTNQDISGMCKCGSKDFITQDNMMLCEKCSLEIKVQTSQTSFKDIDRINTSQKYKYQKKVHFKDTVNQYQGKQNKKNYDEKLYEQLEEEFIKMGLIDVAETNWHKRHKKITKDIIYMVLNDTGNNKRYEDINLIHNYFTGIPCPDISHLEHQLYTDFDRIVDIYESSKVDRKSFLNNKYVLFQLLRIYKYKLDEKDFAILKTRERLIDHDTMWESICGKLEMNFYPCV